MGPKLTRLTLSSYRSFVECSEVDFPLSGLVALNGINKDTGGGSGSGKSNFITAIAYLLGFSPLPYTDFQSWFTDKAPYIEGVFETDQGTFSIIRGKHFQIFLDNGPEHEEIKGSAAQKEAKIDEIFGMSAEFRKMLTHRGQRQPGSFLSNTDAKKKEFLMQILGLDKFEAALETSAKNISNLQLKLVGSKAMKESLENTVANLQADPDGMLEDLLADSDGLMAGIALQKDTLTKKKLFLAIVHKDIQNETDKILADNKILYQEALDKVQALEDEPFVTDVDRTEMNRLATLVVSCKERLDVLVEEDRVKKAAQNVELRKLQNAVDVENGKTAQIPNLNKQYQKLTVEIEKLDAGKCSMCDRQWDEALSKKKGLIQEQEDILTKLGEYNKSRGVVFQLQAQMEPFRNFEANPKIAQMTQAKSNLEAQFATEKQKIDSQKAIYVHEKNAKLSELKATAANIAAEGEKRARELREARMPEAAAIGQEVQNIMADIAGGQDAYNMLQNRISRAQYAEEQRKLYEPKLEEAVDLMVSYQVDLDAEKDFQALIGREGFLSSIFDEILVEISDETNSMLANVANTRHVSIEFKSESVTEKGTIKRSIVPVVNVGGHESTIKSGLSGGMLSVVELATDLAVGKVIAQRTGTCPGFLLLDEVMDGLGVVEKETALELIQKYAQDRLVIMTDHSSETKALFTKTILVEYENGRSIVRECI